MPHFSGGFVIVFFELSSNALRRQVGVEIKTERASKRIIHGRSVTTLVLLEAFGSAVRALAAGDCPGQRRTPSQSLAIQPYIEFSACANLVR
jgi:hypothetical protein